MSEKRTVRCPHCNAKFLVLPEQIGRKAYCPKCETKIRLIEDEKYRKRRLAAETESEDIREAEIIQDTPPMTPRDAIQAAIESPPPQVAKPPSPKRIKAKPQTPEPAEAEPERVVLKKKTTSDGEMDMTPMVDVTFLLLIFFMVTAAFALQKSLEVPTPENTEEQAQAIQMEVSEDENTAIVRILKDNTIWIEDREIPSRQELLAVLREMRKNDGEAPPTETLLVLADGHARHETVVMALDAGNAVGMKNIRLKTEDQE